MTRRPCRRSSSSWASWSPAWPPARPRPWCSAGRARPGAWPRPSSSPSRSALTAAGIADGVSGLGQLRRDRGPSWRCSPWPSPPRPRCWAASGRRWSSLAVLVFLVLGLPASGGPANLARFTPALPALPAPRAPARRRGRRRPQRRLLRRLRHRRPGLGAGRLGPGRRRRPGPVVTLGVRRPRDPLLASARPGASSPARVLANGRARPAARHRSCPRSPRPPASRCQQSRPGRSSGRPPAGTAARPALATSAEPAPDPLSRPRSSSASTIPGPPAARSPGLRTWPPTRSGVLHVVYADQAIIDSDLSGFAHAEMDRHAGPGGGRVEQAAAQIAAAAGLQHTFERLRDAPADAILAAAAAGPRRPPPATRSSWSAVPGTPPIRSSGPCRSGSCTTPRTRY